MVKVKNIFKRPDSHYERHRRKKEKERNRLFEELIKELRKSVKHPFYEKYPTYRKYEEEVREQTEKLPLSDYFDLSQRSFQGMNIDHIISIWDGYKNKMEVNKIASIENLQFIPNEENMLKSNRSYCIIKFCEHIQRPHIV